MQKKKTRKEKYRYIQIPKELPVKQEDQRQVQLAVSTDDPNGQGKRKGEKGTGTGKRINRKSIGVLLGGRSGYDLGTEERMETDRGRGEKRRRMKSTKCSPPRDDAGESQSRK